MRLIVCLSCITPQLDLDVTTALEDMHVPLLQGKLPLNDDGDDDDAHEYHHKGRCSSK